jgi:hypothetical protein
MGRGRKAALSCPPSVPPHHAYTTKGGPTGSRPATGLFKINEFFLSGRSAPPVFPLFWGDRKGNIPTLQEGLSGTERLRPRSPSPPGNTGAQRKKNRAARKKDKAGPKMIYKPPCFFPEPPPYDVKTSSVCLEPG